MSLSNSLFLEEEKKSRPIPHDLDEVEDMSHITSLNETFATFSPEVEVPASSKVDNRDVSIPPTHCH